MSHLREKLVLASGSPRRAEILERAGWPHAVTQTAVNLLLAWLVIRLAAALVPYAALARLISVLAWVVAALNIVHLLGPTLDLLDSVAVVVGGRIGGARRIFWIHLDQRIYWVGAAIG